MSKKNAIILILAVVIGSLGALIWFYFTSTSIKNNPPIQQTTDQNVYDPFGTRLGDSLNQSGSVSTSTPNQNEGPSTDYLAPTTKLRQITSEPVSGYNVFKTKDGAVSIRYMLRMSGHILETSRDSLEIKRLSNTTIPKVQESIWSINGESILVRYLKDNLNEIVSYSVQIKVATSTTNEFGGTIEGKFLPDNIPNIVFSPTSNRIYFQQNSIAGASGTISNPDGTNRRVVFESPLVEWLVSWPREEFLTLTTKPSGLVDGYMYLLDNRSGLLTKVIGGIRGLTTKTSPSTNLVMYSDSSRNTPRLYILDRRSNEIRLLPWETFPEKCVWANKNTSIIYCAVPKSIERGNYPDVWYKGLVSFSDNIWTVNTATGETGLVSDLGKDSNTNIDVIDIKIDTDDSTLFFINKTDLTLWSLGLK